MRSLAPLLTLALLPAAGAAETIWLRGSGDKVWIERSDDPPREARKGLTRIESPPAPVVRSGPATDASPSDGLTGAVVLGDPHWSRGGDYEHDYSPRYYYPAYGYRHYGYPHHSVRHYRSYRYTPRYGYRYRYPRYRSYYDYDHYRYGRHRARDHHGGRHHGHAIGHSGGGDRSINAPSRGGHVVRGGAYRRSR